MNKSHKNDIPVKLFASCLLVKGEVRSAICDIQRGEIELIPNSLYDILMKYDGKCVTQIKKDYNHQYDEIIEEYYDMLEKKEYIFYTHTPDSFPSLDLSWEEPFLITNAIIDIDNDSAPLPWADLINTFERLGCKHLQIRSFGDKPLSFFKAILEQCENSRLVSIDMVLKYQSNFDNVSLLDFCETYPRVYSIYVHSAPSTETIHISTRVTGNLFFVADTIKSTHHCGHISPDYFTINLKTFTEAQIHNTCLNRKVSIDTEGYIRNCPSMKENYGNIKDTTLQDALQHPDFKKYWFINKDQISICKDCEFRYICTDCRAYVEDPQDMYSKPLKCGYNPYTGEWEEWSKNPLKLKAFMEYTNQINSSKFKSETPTNDVLINLF